MQKTFRTQKKHIFLVSGSIIGITLIIAYFFSAVQSLTVRLILVYFNAIIFIGGFDRVLFPMLRATMTIDSTRISGNTGEFEYRIYWKDVIAVWLEKEIYLRDLLFISTARGTLFVPIHHFERREIWETIKANLSAEVVGDLAYQRAPEFQVWLQQREEELEGIKFPIRCEAHLFVRLAGIFLFILFSVLSIATWIIVFRTAVEFLVLAGPFLLLWMVSILILALNGTVEMDLIGITHYAWFSTYHIRWNEIVAFEADSGGGWLVLYGKEKRMALPGPRYWTGESKSAMFDVLAYQMESRGVQKRRSDWTSFKIFSRKSKIY